MLGEIGGVVTSGIEMKFVQDVARRKGFIERHRARFKSIVIVIAAIEVDFQSSEIRRSRQGDRAVAIPENRIGRSTKDLAENTRAGRIGRGAKEFG